MSGQPSDNPYAAPQVELQPAKVPRAYAAPRVATPTEATVNLLLSWLIVFGLNLPLAAWILSVLCRGNVLLGLVIGVVLLFVGSLLLFCSSGKFASSWVLGALCVALAQFVPLGHLVLCETTINYLMGSSDRLSNGQAVLCSLIIGGVLLGISLVIGLMFYLLFFRTRATEATR